MASGGKRLSGPPSGGIDHAKLDGIVAKARKVADQRMGGYREQSLRLYPWVCARCGREFTRENLHELTVHHKSMPVLPRLGASEILATDHGRGRVVRRHQQRRASENGGSQPVRRPEEPAG
jgi:hypothetical protein